MTRKVRNPGRALCCAALLVALVACATPAPPVVPPAAAAKVVPAGSYADTASLDVTAVMPPAPQRGDARYEADRRIFRETRALRDSRRWQMAAADAELDTAHLLRHFACSLDLELTPQQAPRLVQLLQQATRDATRGVGAAKDFYRRQRPFLIDEGPTCVPRETVGATFDYPSGHTSVGWSWGLVLAQVVPSRATPLLARARAIGDSRVVCGMHNASAVEAARLGVSAAMTLVTATPAYQADLDAARAEFRQLDHAAGAKRPDAAACRDEAALVAMPVVGGTPP